MGYLKPGIILLSLFALYVRAQFEFGTCDVEFVGDTQARIRWCYSNSQYYTIDARPVGPVVGAYEGPQQVFGCEVALRNLCSGQTYEVTVRGQTNEMACNFTTNDGDIENIDPSELQVKVTSTSVKFVWKHARCFRLDSSRYYAIKSVRDGDWFEQFQAWGDKSFNATHNQYQKNGLTPGRTYTFAFTTCKIRSRCSSSEFTREIETTANATSPSQPPMLKVESITNESFQISWSEPHDPVDGYVLYIDDWYRIFPWNSFWKAEHLYSDTDYEVSVASFNMDGESRLYSENATIVIRTSPRALDPPRNLTLVEVGTTTFDIAWDLPSNTSSYVTGHRVTVDDHIYWLSGDRNWFHEYSLRPNTQYIVEVAALSGNVMSGPAQTIVWTKEKRDNPARNLTVTYMDSSYFEVAWLPPHDSGNVELRAYVVYVNDVPVASQPRWITTFRKDNLNSTQQPSEYTVNVYVRYESWGSLSEPVSTVIGISKNCTAGGSSSWK